MNGFSLWLNSGMGQSGWKTLGRVSLAIAILLLALIPAAQLRSQTIPCCDTDNEIIFIGAEKKYGQWQDYGPLGVLPTDIDVETVPYTDWNQPWSRAESLKHLDVCGDPDPYPTPPISGASVVLEVEVDGSYVQTIEDGDEVTVTATISIASGDTYEVFTGQLYVGGAWRDGDSITCANSGTMVLTYTFTADLDGSGGTLQVPPGPDGHRDLIINAFTRSDFFNDEWLEVRAIYRCDDAMCSDPGVCATPPPRCPQCPGCDSCCVAGGQIQKGVTPAVVNHGTHTDAALDGNPADGCSSCSGGAGGTPQRPNLLSVSRFLAPQNQTMIGNLSPGVFFKEFDIRLMLYDDPNDDHCALLLDTCTEGTHVFHDDGGTGSYEPEHNTYFYTLYVKDGSNNPATGPDVAATAYIIRHDGWRYDFDIVGTEISTDEYGGRLTKITSPDGFEKTFTYQSFTQTEIDASPTRQFQIDTVTDPYGNTAEFTYHSAQKASRWAVSDIDINSGMIELQYDYNTNGHLETVDRKDDPATTYETISTYTYGIDSGWSAAYIQLDQRLWEGPEAKDRIFLAQDYRTWEGVMVNQFANSLVGRADGAGQKYMAVARHPTTVGLYRIEYRDMLIQWQACDYWRYFTSWSTSGGGYNGYTGTLEDTYYQHPLATAEELETATPPLVIDETGLAFEVEYDSDLNTYRKIYSRDGSGDPDEYEQFLYDSKNRETYRRDRSGHVTLTERDSDGHVVRIATGFSDTDGDGTPTQETGALQTIFGYYPTSHANEGLLKWTTTNAYASGAVSEPSANTRTDFEYNTSGQLTKITKPMPQGQSTRPTVTYSWVNGKIYTITNETSQVTTYTYDSIGRVTQIAYGDGSSEQIWRDETNDIVYRKDRNGVVSRTEYDTAHRVDKTISPYGHDTNILDSSIATVHSAADQSESESLFQAGQIQPYKVTRDDVDTTTTYDFRGRPVETLQYTAQSSDYLTTTRAYVDNMLFSVTENDGSYTKRTYNGYSSDRLTVRKIMTRDPSVTFANNAAVMAATRATGADPAHVIADAVRDLQGNIVQLIDGYGTITMNTFDDLGRQTQSVQAHGTSIALTSTTTYNSLGQVWKTTDPAGMVTESLYDDAGNVKTRTVGSGTASALTTTYTFDPRGRQLTSTAPSGAVTTSHYEDCCGNISGTEDHYGNGSIRIADAGGRTVYQATVDGFDFDTGDYTDPAASVTTSETTTRYFDDGRVQYTTRWKSARGTIDPDDPPIAGIDSVSASDGVTTQYVYFKGFTTSASRVINRLGGGTSTININAAISKLKLAPASGGASVTFSTGSGGGGMGGGLEGGGSTGDFALGRATVVIAPDEKTMQVTITDGAGRTVMNALMTGPAATTPNQLVDWTCTQFDETYTLTGFGTVSRTNFVNSSNKWTSQMTDGFGWSICSMDEDFNLTRNEFDSAGNVLETTDPLSHSVTHVYDALGRRTSTTDDAGTTSTAYNSSTGRVDSQTDAKSQTTYFTYDILGRNTVTTDRLGETTTRAYDSAGRLYTLTDAESRTTTYTYDLLGRKLTTTYPDSSVTTIDYDPSGSWPTGSTVQMVTYESDKSKTMITSFDGTLDKIEYRDSGGTLSGTDDFSYDAQLRKSAESSMDGVTRAFTYTDRGQPYTESTTYGGKTYTVTHLYDTRGRLTGITYPSSRPAGFTYTNRSELDTIKWNYSQFENRAYDTAGRLTSIDRPYTDETRTYDDANRLLTINNTTVGQMTYTWDANSNKLSETWNSVMADWSFTTEKSGGTFTDGYDAEDRFRRFIRSGQSEDIYLARSDIGNITDVEINSTSHTRSYSPAHELTTVDGDSQTFDADGNLTDHHSGIELTWDDANRLVGTDVSSTDTMGIEGENEYGYDSSGKRTWKKVTRSSTVVEHTVYVYAGDNCVAEYNYGANATSPAMEYVYAGNGIDSLVMVVHNNNATRLIATRNQQWSIVSLCDNANGNVLERFTYNQFGERTILAPDGSTVRTSSSYDNPYGYTSRRHDEESGLMYFRARHYDVTTGEFTSRDPLEYVDGMSLMRGYFGPKGVDPTGNLRMTDQRWQQFDCGGYLHIGNWRTDPGEDYGIVLQKVCFDIEVAPCEVGQPINPTTPPPKFFQENRGENTRACPSNCYYEMWRVGFKRKRGISGSPDRSWSGDYFAHPGFSPNTKGQIVQTGVAFFLSWEWLKETGYVTDESTFAPDVFSGPPDGVALSGNLYSGCEGDARLDKLFFDGWLANTKNWQLMALGKKPDFNEIVSRRVQRIWNCCCPEDKFEIYNAFINSPGTSNRPHVGDTRPFPLD